MHEGAEYEEMEKKIESSSVCTHESSIRCTECKRICVCDGCDEECDHHNTYSLRKDIFRGWVYDDPQVYCDECFLKLGGRFAADGSSTFEEVENFENLLGMDEVGQPFEEVEE